MGSYKRLMEERIEKACTCDGGCSFSPEDRDKSCPIHSYLKDFMNQPRLVEKLEEDLL